MMALTKSSYSTHQLSTFSRLRPKLDDERNECRGRDADHINIVSESNVELLKTVDTDISGSVASGLNKNMKYEFEFDRSLRFCKICFII